jgi:peptide/nickel transport system permease protein
MSLVADHGALAGLRRDPMGMLGAILVASFILIALFAPWVAPYDPLKLDVLHKLAAPSTAHPAGTDQLGRDTLSRLIWGTRTAFGIALTATGISGAFGLILGMIAGYGPRWLDGLLVLCFDALSSLPMIMFALAVITVLGPGTTTLILVVVLISIPGYARLIRAQTLTLRNADFIVAEQAMDASATRIILRHMLPNVVGPLIIILSMDVPVVIMLEAGLSYLNLGVKPPTPSWGNMLYDGYTSLRQSPVLVIMAGIPLVLATLGFTFLGEGLRDALDPKLQLRVPK